MKIISSCKTYLFSQIERLILFIVLALLGSVIRITSPYILGDFIDKLVIGANEAVIVHFCVVFGGINAFKIIKDYATSILLTKMQVKMGYNLNMDVIKHIQMLSPSYFKNKEGAYLNHRINDDCYALIAFCLTTLRDIIIHTVMVVFPVIILFSLNKLILAIMTCFILLYVVVYFFMKKKMYYSGLMYRESQAKFSASLLEQVKHIMQIKINSVQPEYHKRADTVFYEYYETAIKSQRINFIYTSFDGIVATFAQIALFVVGGLLVIRGTFTIGLFTIFSSYFRAMLTSCRYFFGLAATYQSAVVSYNRTMDILSSREESNGALKLQKIDSIKIRNVEFSYDAYEQESDTIVENTNRSNQDNSQFLHERNALNDIIRSFSYEFSKGNLYAITGNNGIGKTTLTKLLIGLYVDERRGEILFNNIPMEKIDMIHARKRLIGYAEQNPLLVEDSVYYNLTYKEYTNDSFVYKDEKSLKGVVSFYEQLRLLSKVLNMEQFLTEKQLSFHVNEENTNLSGGESQKLAILKVLLKDSDVMIFDEPTSALDKETKERFIYYLTQLKNDKIIIVVTHDNNLIASCDGVFEMSTTDE